MFHNPNPSHPPSTRQKQYTISLRVRQYWEVRCTLMALLPKQSWYGGSIMQRKYGALYPKAPDSWVLTGVNRRRCCIIPDFP
jgi:hypothetical protein